jgi:hypothetical protein
MGADHDCRAGPCHPRAPAATAVGQQVRTVMSGPPPPPPGLAPASRVLPSEITGDGLRPLVAPSTVNVPMTWPSIELGDKTSSV